MKGERVCAFRVNMINSDVLKQLKQLEKDKYIEMINVGNYEDINEHKLYVVYYDGEPYDKCGMKGVYRQEGTAKALVTNKSKELARSKYKGDWFRLKDLERNKLINEFKKRFEIKEFTEKCKLR